MRLAVMLVILLAFVLVTFRLLRATILHYHRRGRLSRAGFAAMFAGGMTLLVLGMFFISMIVSSTHLSSSTLLLGLGIGLINGILAYPVGLLAYRYFPKRDVP